MKKTESKQTVNKKICILPGCGNGGKNTRGLCSKHYIQFMRLKEKMLPENQGKFDDDQVEKGKILPAQSGGRPGDDNAFAEDAEKYLPQLTPAEKRAHDKSVENARKKGKS